jgi:hypothetical protein
MQALRSAKSPRLESLFLSSPLPLFHVALTFLSAASVKDRFTRRHATVRTRPLRKWHSHFLAVRYPLLLAQLNQGIGMRKMLRRVEYRA